MYTLLVSGFTRIRKNMLFWICCGVMAAFGITAVVLLLVFNDGASQIDASLCDYIIPTEIAVAVFVSIFLGTEYGDGTIRNKLTIGHDRRQIYLANLILSIVCALIFCASYLIPLVIIGFACVGLPSETTVETIFASLATLVSFCSLFTAVGIGFKNKAGSTVVNLLSAFVLLIVGLVVCNCLTAPEFYPVYTGDSGTVEYIPNPAYPVGAARTFLQLLLNVLPGGQAVQIITGVIGPLWALPLYSLGVCAVCTAVGMIVFNKADIK